MTLSDALHNIERIQCCDRYRHYHWNDLLPPAIEDAVQADS